MKMDIEERLEYLCDYADAATNFVVSDIQKLFQLVATDAKRQRFEYTDAHDGLIDSIKFHGVVADSASFVRDRILGSNRSALIDIDLTGKDRSRMSLKETIADTLAKHRGGDRGFVYFAWRSRPERYFYVGKAASSARVNLDTHGKLLESLREKKASRLSLIFPAKSTAENIANLEAALLNLIQFRTDELPEENARGESFSLDYESGAAIHVIRKLIAQVHRKLG